MGALSRLVLSSKAAQGLVLPISARRTPTPLCGAPSCMRPWAYMYIALHLSWCPPSTHFRTDAAVRAGAGVMRVQSLFRFPLFILHHRQNS